MQTRVEEPAPAGAYVVRLPKDTVIDIELPHRQPDPGQQQAELKPPAPVSYIVRVPRDRVFRTPPEDMPHPPEKYRRRCSGLACLFLLVAVLVSVAVVYLVHRFRHPAGRGRPHRQ